MRARGFTLVEVLVAIAITAVVMVSVSSTFITTLRAQREVQSLTESTEAGSRILSLIERDLKGLWTYNIKDNRVLIGRKRGIAGPPADHIDFLTHTDSITTILDTREEPARAPICEVGYWLRPNPTDPLLMELWRREDPMVDDDLLRGGTFQKVHDRLRSFNVTYYKTLGHNAEELMDWDSSKENTLPRVIKIEFTIERKLASTNERSREVRDFEDNNKRYTHYIVLDKERVDVLKPQVALIPVFPQAPSAEDPGTGPGGAGGSSGGDVLGGPAGGGGMRDVTRAGPTTEISGRGDRGGNQPGNGRPPSNNPFGGGRGSNPFGGGFFPGGNNGGSVDLNEIFRQLNGGGGRR